MPSGTKKAIKERCGLDWDYMISLGDDGGYDYLINTYIPSQGYVDMVAFIDLGFNPYAYLLWKLSNIDVLDAEFELAIREKIIKEYGKYPERYKRVEE